MSSGSSCGSFESARGRLGGLARLELLDQGQHARHLFKRRAQVVNEQALAYFIAAVREVYEEGLFFPVMKLYEAARYYYYPGMHEPGSMLSFGVNKSWLSKLSKTDQAILQASCTEENSHQMAETNANNGKYLTRLINEHGVELRAVRRLGTQICAPAYAVHAQLEGAEARRDSEQSRRTCSGSGASSERGSRFTS